MHQADQPDAVEALEVVERTSIDSIEQLDPSEAFAQLAALVALTANPDLVGRPVLLLGLDKVRFRRPVVPGDRLTLQATRLWVRRGIWRFAVEARVEGEKVASAELSATIRR